MWIMRISINLLKSLMFFVFFMNGYDNQIIRNLRKILANPIKVIRFSIKKSNEAEAIRCSRLTYSKKLLCIESEESLFSFMRAVLVQHEVYLST